MINQKKQKLYLWGLWVSFAVLFIVFFATDGLLGDKEFSEYTRDDWSVAMLPLLIMIISGISTLVFALMIIIPLILMYPALMHYMTTVKFFDIDSDTEFLAFDHNEFKRACCRTEAQTGLWISVKEYNLKTRSWVILEEGRYIEDADALIGILQKDYQYDRVKFYHDRNSPPVN